MPVPASIRPLRPFERDCLEFMDLEGWTPMFSKVEDLGGWLEIPYTRDGKDLFLLISGGSGEVLQELMSLASKLDQRDFERVVYARERPLSDDAAAPFRAAGIELLHSELVQVQLLALRQSLNRPVWRAPSTYRTRELWIRDFGGFEEAHLVFPPTGSIAITGVNGAGKSTLLEALVTLFSWVIALRALPLDPGDGILDRQIRNGQALARIGVVVEFGNGDEIGWSIEKVRGEKAVDQNQSGLQALSHWARARAESLALEPAQNRFIINGFPARNNPRHRIWGRSEFSILTAWLLTLQNLENEARLSDPDFSHPELQIVKRAISYVMGGYDELKITQEPKEILLRKRGAQTLSHVQLSDGERRILALVVRVTKALLFANPGLEDPLTGAGVVLIDEFELHLHPGWQRTMLVNLEKTFPNIQFILTTHSPQVLSHIPAGNIFLLETREGKISVRQPPGVHGWDSNRILEILMDVPERPPEYKAALNRVSELLDARDLAAARRALDGVRAELGDNDLEVIRLQAVLEFLED